MPALKRAMLLLLLVADDRRSARSGHRECHIGGDFLLIYKVDDSARIGVVVFVRAGTHADLFRE